MSGIRYFHDCETAAKDSREHNDLFVDTEHDGDNCANREVDDVDVQVLGEDYVETEVALTEEGLASLIAAQTPLPEENHARFAVEIAKQARLFINDDRQWPVTCATALGNATGDDLTRLFAWKVQMKNNIISQNAELDAPTRGSDGDTRPNPPVPHRGHCFTSFGKAEFVQSLCRIASEFRPVFHKAVARF